MRSRRIVAFVGVALLLVAAGAAALLLANRRDVTTSSAEAAKVFREALDNERCFYLREARVGYARAIELDPGFAEALLGLSRLSGDGDQGLALVKRAEKLKDHLTERERLHVDIELAAREKREEDLVSIAKRVQTKYPDDVRAAMVLAGAELAKGDTEGAVRIFTDLLATNANNPVAYNQIGYYYAYRGDMDRALENLKKYQFMLPESANPYDSLGEVLAYSGRYDEAIASLNHSLQIRPDWDESWSHLGVAYEGKGEADKAIAAYIKASEVTDKDGMKGSYLVSALRVEILQKDKDKKAAEDIVERLGKLPKTPHSELDKAFFQAALALIEGRPAETERRLIALRPEMETALTKEKRPGNYKPEYWAWNMLMAAAYGAQGKDAEALPLLEAIANPPNPWAGFEGRRRVYEGKARLAALLARRGDLDRAEKLLEENRKWNPSWAPTREAELSVAQLRREKVLAATK